MKKSIINPEKRRIFGKIRDLKSSLTTVMGVIRTFSVLGATFLVPMKSFGQVDEQYEINPTNTVGADPGVIKDYSVCLSNSGSGSVVAVTGGDRPTSRISLRFLEFTSAGVLGTNVWLTENSLPMVAMDIKPLLSGDGYIICGHTDSNSVAYPMAIIVNNSGVVQSSANYYSTTGMFTRVVELPNGKFFFCHSLTADGVYLTTTRIARYVLTSNLLAATQYYALPTAAANKFDMIHDAFVIDNTHVIIAATITEPCTTNGKSRMVLMNIDPANGTINWQNNGMSGNFTSPKIAVDDTYAYFAFNANDILASCIVILNKSTGAFVDGQFFEAQSTTDCDAGTLLTHLPLVQSIYVNSDGDLFLAGKFILSEGQMPWDAVLDVSNWTFSNENLYQTEFVIGNLDFFAYTNNNGTSSCLSGYSVSPLYMTRNTVDIGSDLYRTVTFDCNTYNLYPYGQQEWQNKTWIYSNQVAGVTGMVSLSLISAGDLTWSNSNQTLTSVTAPSKAALSIQNTNMGMSNSGCIEDNGGIPCECLR